jgi:uncharacterized membrane protein YkvA (DUF1232 family)
MTRMTRPLRALWRTWFERKRRVAETQAARPARAALTAERADRKARRVGKFRQTWDDIQVLVRLIRAWSRGDYREVSRGTIVLVLGALVYFVSPIDAILDGLPVAGYLDDAAIIAWVLSEVRSEVDAFRAWEAETQLAAATEAPPGLEQPT